MQRSFSFLENLISRLILGGGLQRVGMPPCALTARPALRRRVGAARSVSFTSDLVAPFALRQTTFFSHNRRASGARDSSEPSRAMRGRAMPRPLAPRRPLRLLRSSRFALSQPDAFGAGASSAPANFHASPLKGVASRRAVAKDERSARRRDERPKRGLHHGA